MWLFFIPTEYAEGNSPISTASILGKRQHEISSNSGGTDSVVSQGKQSSRESDTVGEDTPVKKPSKAIRPIALRAKSPLPMEVAQQWGQGQALASSLAAFNPLLFPPHLSPFGWASLMANPFQAQMALGLAGVQPVGLRGTILVI